MSSLLKSLLCGKCRDCEKGRDGEEVITQFRNPLWDQQMLSLGYVPTSMDAKAIRPHLPLQTGSTTPSFPGRNVILNTRPQSPLSGVLSPGARVDGIVHASSNMGTNNAEYAQQIFFDNLTPASIAMALDFYRKSLYKPRTCEVKVFGKTVETQDHRGRYMFFFEKLPKFCVSLFPSDTAERKSRTVVSTLSNNADCDILAMRGKSPATSFRSPIITPRSLYNTPRTTRQSNASPNTRIDPSAKTFSLFSSLVAGGGSPEQAPTPAPVPEWVQQKSRNNQYMLNTPSSMFDLPSEQYNYSTIFNFGPGTTAAHDLGTGIRPVNMGEPLLKACSFAEDITQRSPTMMSEDNLDALQSHISNNMVNSISDGVTEGTTPGVYGSLKAEFCEATTRWRYKWNLRDVKVGTEAESQALPAAELVSNQIVEEGADALTSLRARAVVLRNRPYEKLVLIESSAERAQLLRNSLRILQLAWVHDSLAAYTISENVYVC